MDPADFTIQPSSLLPLEKQQRSTEPNMSAVHASFSRKRKRKSVHIMGGGDDESHCRVMDRNGDEESYAATSTVTHLQFDDASMIASRSIVPEPNHQCPGVELATAEIFDDSCPCGSFLVDSVDDLFVHIFHFFVSTSGFVDADSMRSALYVSKKWHKVASSPKIWGLVSGFSSHLVNTEDRIGSKARMVNKCIKFRSSYVPSIKLCSFHSSEILSQGTTQEYRGINNFGFMGESDLLRNKLVGFANLGVHSVGSEGVCFRAEDRSTKEVYAIKVPRDSTGEGVSFRCNSTQPSCTIREMAMLHKLSGTVNEGIRYICLAKAVDMFNGGHLIRWYGLSSLTLDDLIRSQAMRANENAGRVSKHIPISAAKTILRQLLLGLECLHEQGIIHRNLKPKHILVKNARATSQDGHEFDLSRSWIEIADFSTVCVSSLPSELGQPPVSRVGTLWYQSPEILLGDERYGTSTDIWSAGCIFADIIRGGKPLFPGCSGMEQLLLIFRLLGLPSSETWDRFKTIPFFNLGEFSGRQQRGLKMSVPELDVDGLDLLKNLLELDPYTRLTASSALDHNFLQNDSSNEKDSDIIVSKNHRHSYNSKSISSYHKRAASLKAFESFSTTLVPGRRHAEDDQWATIVDWVIEVVDVFDKSMRTAFLAMTYFDHFMSNVKRVKTRKYQLIAATCLHIASKCEDAEFISVANLVFCADNSFSEKDLIELEKVILNQIEWKLSQPLIYDFVCLYVELTPEVKNNRKTFWLAKYLCELALQSNLYLRFRTSKIATCVVSFALHCMGQSDVWPQSLEMASGFKWADLGDCMVAFSQSMDNMRRTLPRLKMITRRYRKTERACVAELTIPSVRSQTDFARAN